MPFAFTILGFLNSCYEIFFMFIALECVCRLYNFSKVCKVCLCVLFLLLSVSRGFKPVRTSFVFCCISLGTAHRFPFNILFTINETNLQCLCSTFASNIKYHLLFSKHSNPSDELIIRNICAIFMCLLLVLYDMCCANVNSLGAIFWLF